MMIARPMSNQIRKAVFPVAGFGTRFLPATKAMPKELLPIVDKPLIQYAAEEAIAAGIDTLIFVTGRNKRAIEDHFDANNELETMLRAKGKDAQAKMVRNITPEGVECIFVRQAEQLGLGHAVLCAERAVGADPFAVLLADDFLTNYEPLSKVNAQELIDDAISFEKYTQPVKDFIKEVVASNNDNYFVTPSHPRIVDGLPTKNPRYLQRNIFKKGLLF